MDVDDENKVLKKKKKIKFTVIFTYQCDSFISNITIRLISYVLVN